MRFKKRDRLVLKMLQQPVRSRIGDEMTGFGSDTDEFLAHLSEYERCLASHRPTDQRAPPVSWASSVSVFHQGLALFSMLRKVATPSRKIKELIQKAPLLRVRETDYECLELLVFEAPDRMPL